MPCSQERRFCSFPGTCAGRLDAQVLFGSLLDITTKPCVPVLLLPRVQRGLALDRGLLGENNRNPRGSGSSEALKKVF